MDKEKISDSMIDELKEIIDFTPIPDGALTFSDMQKEFPGLGDSRLRQAIKRKVDEGSWQKARSGVAVFYWKIK